MNLNSYDIVIVGRGFAGLALAFRLRSYGKKILLLGSKEKAYCASSVAQGVIANKGLMWPFQEFFRIKLKSLEWVKFWLSQIEKQSGCSLDLNLSGVYEPFIDSADYQRLVSRVYKGELTGAFKTRYLPASSLPDPLNYTGRFSGCLHYPADMSLDVTKLLDALEASIKANIEISNDQVTRLETKVDHTLVQTSSDTKIKAKKLVIAAGAGSPKLLSMLGIDNLNFNYHPGQVLRMEANRNQKISAVVRKTYSLVARRDAFYFGSTTSKTSNFDPSWKGDSISQLKDELSSYFDFDTRGMDFDDWCSTRLRYKDRMPVVAKLSELSPRLEHVYLITGFYKNGLQLSDLCASWLEKLLFDQKLEKQAAFFGLSDERLSF